MTQNLNSFLQDFENKKHATEIGTNMHAKMQHIVIDPNCGDFGDKQIIEIIKTKPDLSYFFSAKAKTEVPIAGVVHGYFVSRRIDRLLINEETKTIDFIDYKTDTDKNAFIEQYKHQLKEYAELLRSAYPEYKINGYILWLHNWDFDKIIS
nr:hypothetical protein [Candidatus Enterousia merdequi]